MADEKEVPAEIINNLTEEILKELDQVRKVLMYKNKDVGDEFTHRVVATFGALLLMLEKHVQYMMRHGYSPEHIDRLERVFMESFTLIDESQLPGSPKEEKDLKN